jgi:5-(hydroxymethyl)furfural/furfural oxidase
LSADTRRRRNLTVATNLHVRRILFDGKRATGVTGVRRDGSHFEAFAREVILTAGALRSPELLLRSGIGPAEDLRAAGIDVIVDRAGVGQKLQNHPMVVVMAFLRRGAREARGCRPAGTTYLRWTSKLPGCTTPSDMSMYVRSYLTWHALGRRLAGLTPSLTRPFSCGQIRLNPTNPQGPPKIEFNFFDDLRDLQRMADGVRLALELFESPEVASICEAPVILTQPAAIMRYNQLTRTNALRGLLAATAMDLAPAQTRAVVGRLSGMKSARSIVENAEELAEFIRSSTVGAGHPAATCRMGRPSDTKAVTDPVGRVYGVEALRVADASIMPFVPSCNTHIPVVMGAEKIADAIRRAS